MQAFTVIVGLISVLGVIVQVKGAFPKYRKYFIPANLLLIGFTAGLIVSLFVNTAITVSENVTVSQIVGVGLIGGTGVLVVGCFIATILTSDEQQRNQASRCASGASFFLFFLLMSCYPMMLATSPHTSGNQLTYDERIESGIGAIDRKDFGRALEIFDATLKTISPLDARYAPLQKLIDDTKKKQANRVLDAIKTPHDGAASR